MDTVIHGGRNAVCAGMVQYIAYSLPEHVRYMMKKGKNVDVVYGMRGGSPMQL